MDIEAVLKKLTIEEKAALLAGTDFMHTNLVPRLGLPSLSMADGPHGVRKQVGNNDNGIRLSEPATAFPTSAAIASSWDPENARALGAAIAQECRHYGVGVLLGPGVNIKRDPRCGRNFEYYSEDPLLAGELGAAFVQGLQGVVVAACVKHFAANNSENFRYGHITREGCRAVRSVILQATWSLIRCKEGGRLKEKFFLLSERRGKTRSAVALARRMVGLMWILVTRKEFYADASKDSLQKKFRHYGTKLEGWESKVA